MPNITELDAGPLDIRPSDMGAEFFRARRLPHRLLRQSASRRHAARRSGDRQAQCKSIGDVAMQYMEHREINTAAPHAATISPQKIKLGTTISPARISIQTTRRRQDQINARMNNPQTAQQWREENLDPDLDRFQEAFMTQGGQRWAQDWADAYRSRFTARATADQSSMAGEVVQANIEKTGNTLATAIFSDPSTLGAEFRSAAALHRRQCRFQPDHDAGGRGPVQTELQQASEEKLVQAAVQGAISVAATGAALRTIRSTRLISTRLRTSNSSGRKILSARHRSVAEASRPAQ